MVWTGSDRRFFEMLSLFFCLFVHGGFEKKTDRWKSNHFICLCFCFCFFSTPDDSAFPMDPGLTN